MQLLLLSIFIIPSISFLLPSTFKRQSPSLCMIRRFYPPSNNLHEQYLRRLNSKNLTIKEEAMFEKQYSSENDYLEI